MKLATSRFKLREQPDFFRFARRAHSLSLSLLAQPFSKWEATALAAKSVSKKAVVRNKLKRQLRESARILAAANQAQPARIVVQLKKNATNLSFSELTQELNHAWQKLNRFGSPSTK